MENNSFDYKLPVLEIIKKAIKLPITHYDELFRMALPLILVVFAFTLGVYFNAEWLANIQNINASYVLWIFAGILIYLVVLTLAVIGAHRVYLLEPEVVKQTRNIRWGMREMKYVGWWFIILVLAFLGLFLFGFILGPIAAILKLGMDNIVINTLTSLLVLSPFIMLVSKLSLLLPATATDAEDVNFGDIWNLSYGNSWRLALLVGLLPVITNHLLEYLAFDGLLNMLTYYGAWLIVGAVEVGLLSLCYAYLTENLAEEAVNVESTKNEEISL